ncbi:MAG: hypothetical protein IPM69_07315 [Ignavibacteria bacterium]|nr:hypothetical protein [Ignavibacteria bacterium]
MQTTFNIHTISGRNFRIIADDVQLTEQAKTKRMIYEFTGKSHNTKLVDFILADEVAAIFSNELTN